MLKRTIQFICAGYLLFLWGCATYNPATGRSELIFISTQEEVTMGENFHQQLMQEYKLSTNKNNVERVQRVGQKLAQVSDRQDFAYKFFIVDKDELNAFTTPGGNVYIFSGLLNTITTDDQLAFVLGHEVGHSAAKHTVKKFQAALGADLITNIILSQVGEGAQRVANISSSLLTNIIFSAYGRQDEFEADRLGVKYMYLAGYDTKGSMEALAALKKESEGLSIPLLRTHPYLDDRIKAVEKEVEGVKQKYGQPL